MSKQNPDIWHGKWDPSKVKQTREERKRAKQLEKEEAKQAKKEQKETDFNERHTRETRAQKARADDALAVRRSGRHRSGELDHFDNPALFSDSDEDDGSEGRRSPGGVGSAHLAPRTQVRLGEAGTGRRSFQAEQRPEQRPRRKSGSQGPRESEVHDDLPRNAAAGQLYSSDED